MFGEATVAIDGEAGATTVFSFGALHGPATAVLFASPL